MTKHTQVTSIAHARIRAATKRLSKAIPASTVDRLVDELAKLWPDVTACTPPAPPVRAGGSLVSEARVCQLLALMAAQEPVKTRPNLRLVAARGNSLEICA
ncbi:hypothetical protein [Dyella jiangningensis]|uniref:Uncharacterized protein n=1 Tax=Dyella jiangningensis TaxID=1379159 RepID=A0A328P0T2_9GAMM|nr:hypothetical protein [Dyella jiangningensis]RAO75798.1 hypothetical protein CA260_17320 [Dyella jiangningensis]